MSEHDTIQASSHPATVASLVRDLQALGLEAGQTVLVHTALSRLGWVNGGPVAVIQALERVLGPGGTLVMPTHSGNLSDPAHWEDPPVPAAWWEVIRETMPAYDPDLTPAWGVGIVPETFRKQPGVRRSNHPQVSFAAWGTHAEFVTAGHSLSFGLGEGSPLARIYDLDGWVLLLGAGHGSNTSMHLAEYRAAWIGKSINPQGAPLIVEGERRWVMFEDVNTDPSDFEAIGAAFEAAHPVRQGRVGRGRAVLCRQRAVVDFAAEWLAVNRAIKPS